MNNFMGMSRVISYILRYHPGGTYPSYSFLATSIVVRVFHPDLRYVAGGVDFDDVEMGGIFIVRQLIYLMRQDACHARLANSTWASQQIGVCDFTLFERTLEYAGDMFLSQHLIERSTSVLPIQRLRIHDRSLIWSIVARFRGLRQRVD